MTPTHTIVFSYYSTEEAERYKTLARVLSGWPKPNDYRVECLICTVVSGCDDDPALFDAMAKVMPTRRYRCQTPVVGYPQRPTAMFWEIMDHVAATDAGDGGFALWMEADMVPTRPTWLDALHAAWKRGRDPLVMGRLHPRRYVPSAKILTSPHINGGACYAKQYARVIDARYKHSAFDVAPWPQVERTGRYVSTELFRYSTLESLPRDMRSSAAILHGYRQDKPAFFRRWLALSEGRDEPTTVTVCCDLRTRHARLEYCPIHGPFTPSVRLVNLISVAVARPLLGARRRIARLRKDAR
jgi:hypothetical protein